MHSICRDGGVICWHKYSDVVAGQLLSIVVLTSPLPTAAVKSILQSRNPVWHLVTFSLLSNPSFRLWTMSDNVVVEMPGLAIQDSAAHLLSRNSSLNQDSDVLSRLIKN